MSKLNDLIAKFCPDGVTYKKLSEITSYSKERMAADNVNEDNYVSVENLLQNKMGVEKAKSLPQGASLIAYHEGDILIGNIRPYLKKIWRATRDGGTNGDVLVVSIKDNRIDSRFLYYVLSSDAFFQYDMKYSKGAKMPRGDKKAIMDYKIPIPPMPIQYEITKLLDEFNFVSSKIINELSSELTIRKKQYEYLRQEVVKKSEREINWVPISELGKWQGGKTPSMREKRFWENGTVPWISSKDMKMPVLIDTEDHITDNAITEAGMTILPQGSIAMVTRSGILKHSFPVAYVPFETTINQDIKALTVKEGVSARFVSLIMQAYGDDIRLKTKKVGGTVDSLDFKKIMNYKIPLPEYDEQLRMVEELERIDKDYNELNSCLSDEIEARQKQYEYYRDKLLTFKEAV